MHQSTVSFFYYYYAVRRGLDRIDSDALQRVMVRLGQSTIRVADCEAMICEVDRQGDGYISHEDFHHLQTCAFDNY